MSYVNSNTSICKTDYYNIKYNPNNKRKRVNYIQIQKFDRNTNPIRFMPPERQINNKTQDDLQKGTSKHLCFNYSNTGQNKEINTAKPDVNLLKCTINKIEKDEHKSLNSDVIDNLETLIQQQYHLLFNIIHQLDFNSAINLRYCNKQLNNILHNHNIWNQQYKKQFWYLKESEVIYEKSDYFKYFRQHMGRQKKMKYTLSKSLLSQENMQLLNLIKGETINDYENEFIKWKSNLEYLQKFIEKFQDKHTAEALVHVYICFPDISQNLKQKYFSACLTNDFFRTVWTVLPLDLLVENLKNIQQCDEYKESFVVFYSAQGEICINNEITQYHGETQPGQTGYVCLRKGSHKRFLHCSFPYQIMQLQQFNKSTNPKYIKTIKYIPQWKVNSGNSD